MLAAQRRVRELRKTIERQEAQRAKEKRERKQQQASSPSSSSSSVSAAATQQQQQRELVASEGLSADARALLQSVGQQHRYGRL